MRVQILYPPGGYPFMPYLAPYVLKGHVMRSSPGVECSTKDLNALFHRDLWTGPFGQLLPELLAQQSLRQLSVYAELIQRFGPVAYAALRQHETYEDARTVRRHSKLLSLARVLNQQHTASVRAPRLPPRFGLWGELVDRWERTMTGDWLRGQPIPDADVVGLSVAYLEQLAPALLVARQIKRARPDACVVLGGGGVTHLMHDLSRDLSFWTDVDFVVPFEGEISFTEIIEHCSGERPRPRANVAYLDGDRVHYRKSLTERPHVDAVPDFSDFEHLFPSPEPIYPLLTSKGCYWGKCAYCTHHEGYGQGYKPMSDAVFEATFNDLIARGARSFYFVDEALPPKKIAQLADVMAARRSDGESVSWMAEARLEKTMVKPEAVAQLAASGCRLLINGVESGCQDTLDRMRKGIRLELVAEHAAACHALGIQVGWMFFIGFPGESDAQARETFDFIERNADNLDFAVVGIFGLERGAPIWEQPEAFGIEEIVGRDDPYRVVYASRLADGTTNDWTALQADAGRLREDYARLAGLFESPVDRSHQFFLSSRMPRETDAELSAAGVLRYEWYSEREDAHVRYCAARHRVFLSRPTKEQDVA